jgi:hypothetical protein
VRIAAGAQVPAGGYLVLSIAPEQLALDSAGQWTLSLFSIAENRLTGYRATASLQAPAFGATVGRVTTSRGIEIFAPLQTATPGEPNAPALVGPVVISQMRIIPGDSAQWIELTNLTDQAVPLFAPEHPERTWRIAGAMFDMPSGLTLPPRAKMWIAGDSPATICASGLAGPGVRVSGPFAMPLRDVAMRLTLLRPIEWGANGWTYAVADMLETGPGWPLPGELRPILQRSPLDGFGPDAANWQAVAPAEPTGAAVAAGQLCLFEVVTNEEGFNEIHWMIAHDATLRQYILSSSDSRRSIPTTATIAIDPTAEPGEMTEYTWTDATVDPGRERFYWLAAEYEDGALSDLSFTNALTVYHMVRLPLIAR